MNWESICYVLKSFGIKKAVRKHFESASTVLLLDEYVLDDSNTLYICIDPNAGQRFEKSLIVSLGKCAVEAENCIELETGSVAAVFNALMEPEQSLKMLKELLQDATTNQQIIDLASSYLNTPFFYFDESYRILAITGSVSIENDPEWEYMTTQRFLSPESIRAMQDSGDLDMLAKESKPVIYDAEFFPFASIVTNINYMGKPYARLNRLCMNGKITPIMMEECSLIAKSLHRLLGMQTTMVYTGPVDNMLRDLINGVQLPEPLIRDRLQRRYKLKEDFFMICVIDVNVSEDEHVPSYYSVLIERMFENDNIIHLVYEENLVLLLQAGKENAFVPLLQQIDRFLAQQKLRAGVSNVFQKLTYLKAHYEQAFAALGYAAAGGFVRFDRVMIDYLISLIPDERRELFLSGELQILEEAQQDYSFPLVETLRAYFECNCSLQKSAEVLYVHKNTMLYRLNKLKEILQSDFSDPHQRMIMLLSLKIR